MPIRIYDIARELELGNAQVLAKAKELKIAAARVASSSLDAPSAELLEQELIKTYFPGGLEAHVRELVLAGKRVPQRFVQRFPGLVRQTRAEHRSR